MVHFDQGFYIKNSSCEVYYCTGEVHPKDSKAKRGISVRSEQLYLFEFDLPEFTRLSESNLINICEAPALVRKVKALVEKQNPV
jgi:hypothetical protein